MRPNWGWRTLALKNLITITSTFQNLFFTCTFKFFFFLNKFNLKLLRSIYFRIFFSHFFRGLRKAKTLSIILTFMIRFLNIDSNGTRISFDIKVVGKINGNLRFWIRLFTKFHQIPLEVHFLFLIVVAHWLYVFNVLRFHIYWLFFVPFRVKILYLLISLRVLSLWCYLLNLWDFSIPLWDLQEGNFWREFWRLLVVMSKAKTDWFFILWHHVECYFCFNEWFIFHWFIFFFFLENLVYFLFW